MENNIPNFRIGTDLKDVENYVNGNKANMNQEAVKSIFNFINDDRAVGDGKISNNIELSMLNAYLENATGQGEGNAKGMPMPEPVQLDDPRVTDFNTQGKYTFVERRTDQAFNEISREFPYGTDFTAYNNDGYDEIVDNNHDGIADSRTVGVNSTKGEYRIVTGYSDTDLDGRFDEKTVSRVKDGAIVGEARYKRDEGGKWRMDTNG